LILPLLSAEYYDVRAETARALERIAEPRLQIMSELKRHLNDTNAEVRETVQEVLERLQSEKTVERTGAGSDTSLSF
jgi:HEAT repeat protein